MKTFLCGLMAVFALAGDALAMASRNPNAKLTPDQLANLPEGSNYVSGGESVDRAVSPEVLQSIAAMPTGDGQAVYGRYTTFGEDVAPDQPVADTQALEGKNALDAAMKAFGASKSPQAAAALAALSEASKIAQNLTKPTPQGDRKGGSQLSFMKGSSADVAAVALTDAEQLALMRTKQFPRANAATTTTRTERSEWTEQALETVADAAALISSNYWAFSLAEAALDEQEDDGPFDAIKTPVVPSVTDPGKVESADPANTTGSAEFLWKPSSDSDGKLVVIFPAAFNGRITAVSVNGEAGRYSSTANGNRTHWRFSKPGAAYAAPARVVSMVDGKAFPVTVDSPAKRTSLSGIKPPAKAIPVSEMPTDPVVTPQPEVPAGPGEPSAP